MIVHAHNTNCIPQMGAVSVWGMQSICWMLPLAMPGCYSWQPPATPITTSTLPFSWRWRGERGGGRGEEGEGRGERGGEGGQQGDRVVYLVGSRGMPQENLGFTRWPPFD